MSAFSPAIIFFDIDDTLYHTAARQLPASVAPALAALQRRGIVPAIATGRSPGAFPEKIDALIETLGLDTVVALNGLYCRHQGRTVVSHPLDKDYVARVIALCERHGWAYMQMTAAAMLASRDDALMREVYANIGSYRLHPAAAREDAVYQMNILVDEAQEAVLAASGILGADYRTVRWHRQAVDLLAQDASKARGIAEICAHLGIAREQVMVFGDGLNDLEMFAYAAYAVAMGDAQPPLLAAADFITRRAADDGIAYALKTLGII